MDKMNNKMSKIVYICTLTSTNFLAETIIIMFNFLQTPVTLVVLVVVVVMGVDKTLALMLNSTGCCTTSLLFPFADHTQPPKLV